MEHLFDTCTIKHHIANEVLLEKTIEYCLNLKEAFSISDEIKKELKPPYICPENTSQSDYEKAKNINSFVQLFIRAGKIKVIILLSDEKIRQNFDKIRKCHYGWMTRPDYCKAKGITSEEFRSPGFKYKDYGECSLIAIALTSPKDYTIISNDKGRVYAHPHINIFDQYKEKGLNIVTFQEWIYFGFVCE